MTTLSEFADVDALGAAAAVDYLDAAAHDLAPLKRRVRALLRARPGDRILDAGCGLGDDVRALSDVVGPRGVVIGLDASAVMIAEAKRRTSQGRVRFVLGDAASMPFMTNAFDAVRVERMLQHVADPATALGELTRVLRPAGRIVIAEPDWPDLCVLACPDGLADDIARRLRARIRQPELARSLAELLDASGLCSVREHRLPLAIHDGVMARRIVARTGIGARARAHWRTRTHELRQQGLAFVTVPVIAVTAGKHGFSCIKPSALSARARRRGRECSFTLGRPVTMGRRLRPDRQPRGCRRRARDGGGVRATRRRRLR